jgi:hypothetical protein
MPRAARITHSLTVAADDDWAEPRAVLVEKRSVDHIEEEVPLEDRAALTVPISGKYRLRIVLHSLYR